MFTRTKKSVCLPVARRRPTVETARRTQLQSRGHPAVAEARFGVLLRMLPEMRHVQRVLEPQRRHGRPLGLRVDSNLFLTVCSLV